MDNLIENQKDFIGSEWPDSRQIANRYHIVAIRNSLFLTPVWGFSILRYAFSGAVPVSERNEKQWKILASSNEFNLYFKMLFAVL